MSRLRPINAALGAIRTIEVYTLCVGLILIVSGCNRQPIKSQLALNLAMAGLNKSELESVLEHYKVNGDTLGLQSAIFLIENMHLHHTTECETANSVVDLLRQTRGCNVHIANVKFDSLVADRREPLRQCRSTTMSDLRVISADQLISNIDEAVSVWQSAPWHNQVSFEMFCEYILPYKSGTEPIGSWRGAYRNEFSQYAADLDTCTNYVNAALILLRATGVQFRYIHRVPRTTDFAATDLIEVYAGQCDEMSHLSNYVLRSHGIPATMMYAPQWGTHNQGHSWTAIAFEDGLTTAIQAGPGGAGCFDVPRRNTKTAKLYMLSYSANQASLAANVQSRKSRDIPRYLTNPCMIDVTPQVGLTTDISIDIERGSPKEDSVVFVCVLGREKLNAIDWAKIADGSAEFNHLGNDILYLPAYYQGRKYIPAADPFAVSYDGDIMPVKLDTSEWIETPIYRKYPLKSSMFRYTRPFLNMRIQVSDDASFTNPIDVDTIKRYPNPRIKDWSRMRDRWKWEEYLDSVVIDPPVPARFVRMFAAPNMGCIVGEMICKDEGGKVIEARAFGSAEHAENVQDGIYGETYHDPDTNGWIALDLGEPKKVSSVVFLPSHDSNSIQVGTNYELFYWNNGWASLGKQTADTKILRYSTPKNALFLLKNLDGGVEERVFTLDPLTREQVWW